MPFNTYFTARNNYLMTTNNHFQTRNYTIIKVLMRCNHRWLGHIHRSRRTRQMEQERGNGYHRYQSHRPNHEHHWRQLQGRQAAHQRHCLQMQPIPWWQALSPSLAIHQGAKMAKSCGVSLRPSPPGDATRRSPCCLYAKLLQNRHTNSFQQKISPTLCQNIG